MTDALNARGLAPPADNAMVCRCNAIEQAATESRTWVETNGTAVLLSGSPEWDRMPVDEHPALQARFHSVVLSGETFAHSIQSRSSELPAKGGDKKGKSKAGAGKKSSKISKAGSTADDAGNKTVCLGGAPAYIPDLARGVNGS